jgi:hypothetical protein
MISRLTTVETMETTTAARFRTLLPRAIREPTSTGGGFLRDGPRTFTVRASDRTACYTVWTGTSSCLP